jgi:acetylornithine deacetylase/succinyl-diaminopimelate desuccinylase-like protein
MTSRARLLLFSLALLLVVPACREAEGVAADPMDREAEDTLVELLTIDTTNPPGNETTAAAFLRDRFAKDGIEAKLVGADPKRQAVYARLSSGTNEKALLLLSHLDVVPAGTGWKNPPFSGMREGGYLWGRGALDLKSLTVAEFYAVVDLKRRGAKLKRDIVFLAVPDEELGGLKGTKALLETNPELFANVGFVLNEGGTNETAVDKVIFWGIEVQQKNPLWLELVAEGRGGHSSVPPDNGGATRKLVHALAAVETIPTPYELDPSVARSSAAIAKSRKDGRAAIFGRLRAPLDVGYIEKELPEGYRSILRDTIAVTHLSAGSAVNIMPAQAVAKLDIRLLPGHASGPMIAAVQKAVGDNAKVQVLLSTEPVADSPSSGELYEILARAMRESSPGSTVGPTVAAGTNDNRFFRARGIVAYGIAPFKVNYYDADSVHSSDERIRARFFAEGVRLTRRIVRDFCAQ